MTSELTNLESWNMTCHQDIVVRAPFDDDLRLIGRRAGFISGLVVHRIFQLATVSCDLKQEEAADVTTTLEGFMNLSKLIFYWLNFCKRTNPPWNLWTGLVVSSNRVQWGQYQLDLHEPGSQGAGSSLLSGSPQCWSCPLVGALSALALRSTAGQNSNYSSMHNSNMWLKYLLQPACRALVEKLYVF